jgi:WYL domain
LFDASLQRGEASAIESDRLRDPIGPSTSRAETGEDAPERPVRTPVARAATPGEPAGRDPPGAGGGSAQRRSTKHIRTLRRDLEALETAGYPLLTERVDGQTRWRLADGSRAPAIGFSPTELMTLAVSRDLLRPLEGTALRSALDSAVTKATAALPPGGPDLVRQMRDWLSVPLGPAPEARDTIDRLTRTITERRTVQVRYFTAARQVTSRREIDHYHLRYVGGALYLDDYDHLRRKLRTFAVERVRSLTVTDRAFQLPLGFDLDSYLGDALIVIAGYLGGPFPPQCITRPPETLMAWPVM